MYGQRWREAVPEVIARVGREELLTVERMLERRFNCPATSSLGRLFDAVAFLLGLADENRHEAQAAMALEAAAAGVAEPDPLSFEIESGQDGGPLAMNVLPALRTVVERRAAGGSVATLAAAFHATVAAMLAETAARVAERAGLEVVALSGGCFLNRLLTRQVRRRLTEAGLRVLTHRRVPPGDGGISLGQAVIAARRLAQGAN